MRGEEDQNVLDTLETMAEDVKRFKMKSEGGGASSEDDTNLTLSKEQATKWLNGELNRCLHCGCFANLKVQSSLTLIFPSMRYRRLSTKISC